MFKRLSNVVTTLKTNYTSNIANTELDALLNENYSSDYAISQEPLSIQSEIKTLCSSCNPEQQNKNYEFIWVDQNMDSHENQILIKCFRYLGFSGFKTIKCPETYKMFIDKCTLM